jgi:hypothetical protein
VTIANDSTGVVSVDDNGGSLTVDGTVTANLAAGTNNIGDVDVLTVPAPLSTTGNGTAATALRVTIASDTTGVVAVTDNGGSLTVDGTVTANLAAGTNNIGDVDVLTLPAIPTGSNEIGRVRITDGTDLMDVLDLTNSNPAAVAIVDGNGDQITSFGGGTQYTEDAAAAANPVGTAQILVRQDTPATLVTTDGDNVARRGTNYGAAYSQIVTSTGAFVDTFGGGSQFAVDAVAGGTDQGTLALVVRDDALATLTPADGDYTQLRVTSQGRLWTSATIDAALPAGTNNIGDVDVLTLPALPAGTNNIGDVDVLTVPAPLNVTGGGVETGALRVTIANDSTGVVSVDDNGASLTVDGTVSISGTVTVDSELPAAAALADNAANPTAPAVGAFNMVWDGSTWDRAAGTSADGALVNLGANNDVTVTSGNITADTELPAAAALADNTANPTVPAVGSFGMVWDGSTWDRQAGTSADGTLVNLGANNDVTVTSGNITADTELPAAAALADNTSNPTVPAVGAFNMLFDGSTWDRAPGNSAGGVFAQGNVTSDTPITANPLLDGGRASTATPTAVSADGDAVAVWSDRNGAQMVRARPAATATLANVAGSASSVTLQAANTARLGLMIYNDSTALLYVKFGATASTSSFTVRLGSQQYYELPNNPAIYTGVVDGIWASATGNARVTEITS